MPNVDRGWTISKICSTNIWLTNDTSKGSESETIVDFCIVSIVRIICIVHTFRITITITIKNI